MKILNIHILTDKQMDKKISEVHMIGQENSKAIYDYYMKQLLATKPKAQWSKTELWRLLRGELTNKDK